MENMTCPWSPGEEKAFLPEEEVWAHMEGNRSQWFLGPLLGMHTAPPHLWSPCWERSAQPLGTRTSNVLPDWGEGQESQHLPPYPDHRHLEDRCPAVHPNAGRGYFPGIWKRPWSQQLSQHMHGTCATVPLTCPVPVLAWPVLICPHLPAPSGVDHPGDPHIPLAWPSLSGIPISHLGSPHPLGPLIGFKSGGKNRVWP